MSGPNAIDRHVGGRLRLLREARGLRLEDAATTLEMPAARLVRLESGEERVSAGLLRRICAILRAAPADIFAGLTPHENAVSKPATHDETAQLMSDFKRIRDARTRRLILSLVATYAAFGDKSEG